MQARMTQSRHMLSENNSTQRVAMLAHTVYVFDPRVRREAEALAQQGFEVHVVSLTEEGFATQPQPKTAMVNGVHVHRLPIKKKRGSSLRYLFEYFMTGWLGSLKLAALHLHGKLKVVHVHNMPDILILSAVIPRLGGSKLVLDIHDPMPELYMSSHNRASNKWMVKLLRLQERVSCSLADRVISVNDSMRENLRDKAFPTTRFLSFITFRINASFQSARCRRRGRETRMGFLFCIVEPLPSTMIWTSS